MSIIYGLITIIYLILMIYASFFDESAIVRAIPPSLLVTLKSWP
ncbi:hypothetical protein SAMN04515668_1302 [Hymenobacter arizonensis]|uniref:Uncharacterized protein n=1 Tax=Hymenobacter arizonensis TaxID=1227077 RepID=A0A1I5VFR9_HYMAR|nr:hypothetical protein SAMN04515668_1302 [Hymenobacter arizonensis]